MAYIANKPVRFDRDYKVGEVIPDTVISSGMTRKLMEMGRILHVDLPAPGGNAEDSPSPAPEDTQGGAGGEGGTITPKDAAPPAEGAESAPGGDSGTGEATTRLDGENQQEGAEGAPGGAQDAPSGEDTNVPAGGEFVCEVCGRAFSSQQALAAHSRSHKD